MIGNKLVTRTSEISMDIQCLQICTAGLICADISGCLGSQLLFLNWRTFKNILRKVRELMEMRDAYRHRGSSSQSAGNPIAERSMPG